MDEVSTSSEHRVQIKDPFCQTQEEKLKINEQIITIQALILFENTTVSYLKITFLNNVLLFNYFCEKSRRKTHMLFLFYFPFVINDLFQYKEC